MYGKLFLKVLNLEDKTYESWLKLTVSSRTGVTWTFCGAAVPGLIALQLPLSSSALSLEVHEALDSDSYLNTFEFLVPAIKFEF